MLSATLVRLAIAVALQVAPGPASVSGLVVDLAGAPVAGARVRTDPASAEALSRHDGTFDLAGVPARALLVVSAPGHADLVAPIDAMTASGRVRLVLQPRGITESVTVTGGAEGRVTTPGSATVLDAEAIAAFPGLTVDDRLRSVPGFSLFRRSSSRVANPTTQGVTLRGLAGSGASRTAVFADGISANDPFGGWVYWNRIPLAAIDRIEVARGGSSDLHGSDAMGGAIHIETASRGAALLAEGGADRTGRASLFAGRRWQRWDARGAIERFVTDGYIQTAPESRGPIDTAAGSRHTTAYAGAGVPIARASVDVRGGYFSERRENGTSFQVNATITRHGSGSARGALFDGVWTARGALFSQGYDQTFSAVLPGRAAERPTSAQHVDSAAQDVGGEWMRSHGRGALLVGASGRFVDAQLADLSFTTGGITSADARQRTQAVFAQATVAVGRATIGAGLRGEFWQTRRADGSDSRDEQFLVPRGSLAYRASESITLRTSYQDGHRSPTINELYRDFRVGNTLTRANAALGPERARGWEASVLVTRPWIGARAAVFWTTMDDAIVNVTLDAGATILRQRQNAGRVRARGLEIESDLRLAAGVAITANCAVVDSTFTEGSDLVGLRVPQVPRMQASAGFRGTWPHLTAAVEWRFIGHQYDDDRNAFLLDRSSMADLKAAWRAGRGLELFAALENAFDEEQDVGRTPIRTIGLPRTFRAGLRWSVR